MLQRQEGIASLIGVTLTSFLILIIVTSLTLLMTGELRQATDTENSVKAYYAADSASEESVDYIKQKLLSGASLSSLDQGCASADQIGDGSAVDAAITCRQVQTYATNLDSVLADNVPGQWDLSNGGTYVNSFVRQIDLRWDSKDQDKLTGGSAFTTPGLGSEGSWSYPQVPPIMEVSVTNYFHDQPANTDGATSGTVILMPYYQTACDATVTCYSSVNFQSALHSQGGLHPIVPVRCEAATPGPDATSSRCHISLTNITVAGYKTIVRLRPRYGDAKFGMLITDDSGGQIHIPLKNAQVDTTTKIGDSYRRLTVEVPIRSGVFAGLADALYGGTSLCKDLEILQGPGYLQARQPDASYQEPCPLDNSGL